MGSVSYSERLTVPVWWWLAVVGLAASLAVAVFAYLDWPLATAITLSLLVGLLVLLVGYGRTRLEVAGRTVAAGRARIGIEHVGEVTALDEPATSRALGAEADHRAFLLTRPYIPTTVRIQVRDAADPHPYWLISSRRPQAFAAAIEQARVR